VKWNWSFMIDSLNTNQPNNQPYSFWYNWVVLNYVTKSKRNETKRNITKRNATREWKKVWLNFFVCFDEWFINLIYYIFVLKNGSWIFLYMHISIKFCLDFFITFRSIHVVQPYSFWYNWVVLNYVTKSKRNETKRNITKRNATKRNILKCETQRNILKCETKRKYTKIQ
jgi:hypothetical protein